VAEGRVRAKTLFAAAGRATNERIAEMKIARRQFKVEVPTVAMGDIAFNLLIFFVILAKTQDDSHLQWTAAKTNVVDAAKKARVSIVVDKDNKLYLNGREIDEQRIGKAVDDLLGDAPAGERTVLLKIHHQSQALRFEPILHAVGEAGGEVIHILQKTAGN
jgi:biopolymer transport protein ExbD